MLVFTVSVIALSVGAFLQTTNIFLIGLTKPDVVLALLVVIAHIHKDWTERAFLVLIPALILKFSPTLVWVDVIFIISAFFAIALVDYLPWRRAVNSMVAATIGTVAINLPSFNVGSLALELGINLVLVAIFFVIMELTYEKKTKNEKSRL